VKLRQDLKVHHFDLANQIKDVSLLAQTTKDNLMRSFRILKLRAKYQGTDKLPEVNTKIWYKEIANQKNDLTFSLKRCREIVKVLEKLQKDCARTADDLNNVLLVIKDLLKKAIEKSKVKIADL